MTLNLESGRINTKLYERYSDIELRRVQILKFSWTRNYDEVKCGINLGGGSMLGVC